MVVNSYQKKVISKCHNSIPSRESIILWLKKSTNFISQKNLEKKFCIHNEENKKILRRRLRLMEQDGQVIYIKHRFYTVPENCKIIKGTVIGHKDGYGFLKTEILKDDLFLSSEQMKYCIHGDIILAYIVSSNKYKRKSAKFLKLLKANNILIVGRYYVNKKINFVIPDDARFNFKISIISDFKDKIAIGSIVVVKLIQKSIRTIKIKGYIVEILGTKMGTNLAIDIALRTYSIPSVWSKEVKNQLYDINNKAKKNDFNHRIDLRHLPFITIDDEDAHDFDDAVFCKKKNNTEENWNLWVAIADVSFFIEPNTALDKEAFSRGTSIYFPSLVIPMFPEKISTDLCSLKPYVERLCLICEMNLSHKGELISYKHYEAVICSHGRFTYNEIAKIWHGDLILQDKYKKFLKDIQNLFFLQKIFNQYKVSKKGIYFNNIEPKFILDSNFRIKKICEKIRNDAHKFIESCMILANISSACFIQKYAHPVLFRNHAPPKKENIVRLRLFLHEIGLTLSGGEIPQSIHYSNLLKKIANHSQYEIIQTILLRSMTQAIYSPDNCGHFGLSLSSYVHFTSPIRRYPDLIVHRIIKYLLLHDKKNIIHETDNIYTNCLYNTDTIREIGMHCSMTERRADEANRDVIDWLKCDFMYKKIGHILNGVISNVTSFGFFVRLNQFFIDGLVHITSLNDDYYYFDSLSLKLIGKSNKNIYRLGDALQVQVVSVNLKERKIELSLYKSC
ncbi:ribonuclease R [Buchnera aphidicola]|uniref:Ribonuclease R n=1 Tax=Buchnera aphidicola str. Ua (Uroleucon ambrosiae) TaxID=1005057 RepID=G2LQ42_BUCUM|nr:ribonuclease R [Buchnera aphidicola]AEO08329.1 VacB protein [Buchnera aphidicola str. Ua (Uroleucon ambrosiae)]